MIEKDKNILFTEEQIQKRISEIANTINRYFYNEESNDNYVFIGVLKGAFMFLSDLVKQIEFPIEIDFIQVSSYGNNTTSSGEIKLIKDITTDIENKVVFIVEDIIATGLTIDFLVDHLKQYNPKAIYVVSLFEVKNKHRTNNIADIVGFMVDEDKFICGYGLDNKQYDRNLPYIYYINV